MNASIPATVFSELPAQLPAGYMPVPLTPGQVDAPVRLCVVIRTEGARGPEGPFVVLRETLDAKVHLGCVADASGQISQWVEIWVQDLSGVAVAPATFRQVLSNEILDRAWQERVKWFARVQKQAARPYGSGLIYTGMEESHPRPILIDTRKLIPVVAVDRRTNAPWELCRDEAVLRSKGAPSYSSSLVRCLWQAELGEQSPLLEIDPAGFDVAAVGGGPDVAALNPGGGLLMCLPYLPLSYESYVDAITGGPTDTPAGDELQRTLAQAASAAGVDRGGWLGLQAQSIDARLAEVLHLKLLALAGAVSAVRSAQLASQTPLLNVTAASFRVRTAEGSGLVPIWWTARIGMVHPGESVELPIPATQAKYYMSGRGGTVSIYSPAMLGRSVQGRGWLRLRNVLADVNGTILEGTLATQERVQAGANDLLWLRFAAGSERIDLYAVVDAQQAMAAGEIRIRTLPHGLGADLVARLKAALGVPIQDVNFEMVPLLSSPCDLYAMGVLAARTLLVDGKRSLPVALDDLLSLAVQAGRGASDGLDLAERVEKVLESDARYADSLGPHRLLFDATSAASAFVAIPPRLWSRVLAMVIRMFTGVGPDSICRDFGDAQPGGIHKVFDPVLNDMYALLVASRSLLISDFSMRSELRNVISECLTSSRR